MGLLDGRRAFVSGGSRGIGKAVCEILAREGADVAFNYNSNDEAAAETLSRIEAHGRKGKSFKVSVTDREGLIKISKEIQEEWGPIDALVNNAAVNKGDNFATTTEKAWLDIVNTNVNGLYYVTKPFYKQMMRNRYGSILNISSIGGVRALPTSVHYATTKAAVVGFTKCLAREAGQFNVSVNSIAAGIFDTDLGHSLPERFNELYETWSIKGRMGRPSELAEFAAFVLSDRNTYMTGEVMILDGGTII